MTENPVDLPNLIEDPLVQEFEELIDRLGREIAVSAIREATDEMIARLNAQPTRHEEAVVAIREATEETITRLDAHAKRREGVVSAIQKAADDLVSRLKIETARQQKIVAAIGTASDDMVSRLQGEADRQKGVGSAIESATDKMVTRLRAETDRQQAICAQWNGTAKEVAKTIDSAVSAIEAPAARQAATHERIEAALDALGNRASAVDEQVSRLATASNDVAKRSTEVMRAGESMLGLAKMLEAGLQTAAGQAVNDLLAGAEETRAAYQNRLRSLRGTLLFFMWVHVGIVAAGMVWIASRT